MVNNKFALIRRKTLDFLTANKQSLLTLAIVGLAAFIYFKPQQFTDLWLTRDQQGQFLFTFGHYQQASKTFNNTRWQAYSAYANEDFKHSALLYAQYKTSNELLAQGNALAQGQEYLAARDIYQTLLKHQPNHAGAQKNIIIVQDIIDEINRLSASQQPEQGESIKELGDQPKRAEGADQKEAQTQEVKQLSAEQLLLDPKLNDMWLRQVQKNPGNFLSQKFYMQVEQHNSSIKQLEALKDSTEGVKNE